MRGIKALGGGQAAVQDDLPIPTLRPDYVTIQTKAVALNPTDWKHRDFIVQPDDKPCTLGCDFAGIVEEVGPDVKVSLHKGDRVCGFAHGGNTLHNEDGTFGEYLTAKGDLVLRIPETMSFEDAATFGVGTFTVGQGLYQQMGFSFPGQTHGQSPKKSVLIYGGSTASGMFGIQFAKMSGFEVITTCSPRNADLVKSFGADHVFDYSSPSCGAEINKITNNELTYAWDTIGDDKTAKICAEALSTTSPATYGSIIPVKFPREDVKCTYSLGYTIFGEKVVKRGNVWEASQDDLAFALKWVTVVQKLLTEGKLRPAAKEARSGGLDDLSKKGLDDLKEGRVSGKKLVYAV